MTTDSCLTAIPWNFDKILGGGFPKGHLVLLTGEAGIGKTIFGMEFLYNGFKIFGEKGLYISLDEDPNELLNKLDSLGWDLRKEIHNNNVILQHVLPPTSFKISGKYSFFSKEGDLNSKEVVCDPNKIIEIIEKYQDKVQRIVIDPLPSLGIHKDNENEVYRIYQLIKKNLDKRNVVCMVISQLTDNNHYWSIEPFAADATIIMKKEMLADNRIVRSLRVEKNRGMPVKLNDYVFEIRGKEINEKDYKILANIEYDGKIKKIPLYGIWIYDSSFETFTRT